MCNVAEFSTLLSQYKDRIYVMKSPLFGSQEENPSPKQQGHSYFCIIYLFLWYFSFSCERKLCGKYKARRRRRTAFQLATFPSALSIRRLIVGRFAIATTQPPTSAEDRRLQLGLFAEATYYCYLPLRVNYLINFAFI